MKSTIFRICAMLIVSLVSLPALRAEEHSLVGVWNVSVTVTDCNSGAIIRTVHSLQAYHRDGTVAETANSALRGPSEGVWRVTGDRTFKDSFYFYRYTAAGLFASLAHGTDAIKVSEDGKTYTSTGNVHDFDANGNLLSTGCVIHTAYRLQ